MGTADVSSDHGITAPPDEIDLCCMGGAYEIQGIADPDGNFDLFVPLEVPGTSYSSMGRACRIPYRQYARR